MTKKSDKKTAAKAKAKAKKPDQVAILTREGCGFCARAKKLLKELQSSIGFYEVQTGQSVGQVLTTVPEGFNLHPTLAKRFIPRRQDRIAIRFRRASAVSCIALPFPLEPPRPGP